MGSVNNALRASEDWQVEINGEPVDNRKLSKGYLPLQRDWSAGDEVHLRLPMPVRRLAAHPKVQENLGKVALMRGPLVYCIEGEDNPGLEIEALCISSNGDTIIITTIISIANTSITTGSSLTTATAIATEAR